MGKKSVGYMYMYIFKFHHTEGEKECSIYTLSPHLYGVEKEWGAHPFSPSVWWGERVGGGGRGTLFLT